MMIKREDVRRMKIVAEQIANAKSEYQIHTIEMSFIDLMSDRYGKDKAKELLVNVWNMSKLVKTSSLKV